MIILFSILISANSFSNRFSWATIRERLHTETIVLIEHRRRVCDTKHKRNMTLIQLQHKPSPSPRKEGRAFIWFYNLHELARCRREQYYKFFILIMIGD